MSRIGFEREPEVVLDGISVFLPVDKVDTLDEYKDGNPYRDEFTHELTWDHFRFASILDATIGPNVLDLGCGEGEFSAALASRFTVEGLDVSLTAIREATSRAPEAHFVVADALEPPYLPQQFNTVVLANLFEHVESPCALLRCAKRQLCSGGRLVLSTPSRYKTRNFRRAFLGKPMILNSPNHVTEYTNGQVAEMLRWCGFDLIGVTSNLKCRTTVGTVAARVMQFTAKMLGSHVQFGDPTTYVAVPEC